MNALELATAERRAREVVQKEVEEIQRSGEYGHVSKTKPEDTIQILFENFNSLGVWATGKARRKKVGRLKHLLTGHDADLFAGCKTPCGWQFTEEHKCFENLFGQGQERREVVGYNTTQRKIE